MYVIESSRVKSADRYSDQFQQPWIPKRVGGASFGAVQERATLHFMMVFSFNGKLDTFPVSTLRGGIRGQQKIVASRRP